MRILEIDVIPEEHYWILHHNGEYVGDLFSTHHPTIPYEVYYKPNGIWGSSISSARCYTQEEAVLWIMTQISRCGLGIVRQESKVESSFFGPWKNG
jgi:hypothetical protein